MLTVVSQVTLLLVTMSVVLLVILKKIYPIVTLQVAFPVMLILVVLMEKITLILRFPILIPQEALQAVSLTIMVDSVDITVVRLPTLFGIRPLAGNRQVQAVLGLPQLSSQIQAILAHGALQCGLLEIHLPQVTASLLVHI